MPLFPPVAIIGAACRLPGDVHDLKTLWELLVEGKNAISTVPQDRWSRFRFGHPDKNAAGRTYSTQAGIVPHLLDFDAAFFGITAQEAPFIDPQQRLALELSWEATENAGIRPTAMSGTKTAVFFGASAMDWALLSARDITVTGPRTMTGMSMSIIANRVSYCFNLHGPSQTLDTACSSSLYALHQACLTLNREDVPMAIAGGINVLITPDAFVGFSKAGMLAPDGRCKTFDASANGYVRGEGGGAVLLKTLDRALHDGDRMHAVIRACRTNSDGKSSGITLPNQDAQEALLREIYDEDGVNPRDLIYLETHGTGTSAGDPIEAGAIGGVIGLQRDEPLYVGSIKTNIGHLEPGAGMAGMMKALLVLKNRTIPPNLHFTTPNPAIDFDSTNLRVPTEMTPISRSVPGTPCVGVNAFAFGGSNAHVVLELPPEQDTDQPGKTERFPPLILSARSPESLRMLAGRYLHFFSDPAAPMYYDVAANAARRRDWLRHRLLITAGNKKELMAALEAAVSGAEHPAIMFAEAVDEVSTPVSTPRTAFVFSGNGSQWQGMGVELMQSNAAFAAAVTRVDALFRTYADVSVLEEMHRPDSESHLDETQVAQPLLFAVQVGLVEALREKGISPDLTFGHSIGEAAAAWCSGALSLEDAVAFIHYRGHFQAGTKNAGFMTAANISREEGEALARAWNGDVEVAGDNASGSITLSGSDVALSAIEQQLSQNKIFCKRLPLAYPFHSKWMEDFRDDLLQSLHGISPRAAQIPFISTVTGRIETGETLDAGYLWRNVREPVQFRGATQTALDMGARVFMEIGPHPVLGYYLKDAIRRNSVKGTVLQVMRRNDNGARLFDKAWKNAWASGWIPDLDVFFPTRPTWVDLPGYPWFRLPARPVPSEECLENIAQSTTHPLLGWRCGDRTVWEGLLDVDLFPVLEEHQVMDVPIFPGTGYVEIALAAARELFPGEDALELRHVSFLQSMALPRGTRRRTRVVYNESDTELLIFSRSLAAGDDWITHMRCRVRKSVRTSPAPLPWLQNPDSFGQPLAKDAVYSIVPQYGFYYGPSFAAIDQIWRNGTSLLGRLVIRDEEMHRNMQLSPALLDAAMQLTFVYLHENPLTRGIPFLPVSMGRVTMFAGGRPAWSQFIAHLAHGKLQYGDIFIYDSTGCLLATIENVRIRLTNTLMSAADVGPLHSMTLRAAPRITSGTVSLSADVRQVTYNILNRTAPSTGSDQDTEFADLLHGLTLVAAHSIFKEHLSTVPATFEDIALRLQADGSMRTYLRYLLETLTAHGILEMTDAGWISTEQTDLPDFGESWRGLLAEFPSHGTELALLGRVAVHLRQIIMHESGAELLFSNSGSASAGVYHDNAMAFGSGAECLRGLVTDLLRHCPQGQTLHILELDAGNGRLLDTLAPVVDSSVCRYSAGTSDVQTRDALQSQWAGRDNLSFIVANVEEAPDEQDREHYQCLLAPHCLHAAANLQEAAANCLDRLAPGGLLVLVQQKRSLFTDFVFGISPGWWHHSPSADEPASPLPDHEDWVPLLRNAGFDAIDVVAENKEEFILTARKPVVASFPAVSTSLSGHWIILADEEPSEIAGVLQDCLCRRLGSAADSVQVQKISQAGERPDILRIDDTDGWKEFWTNATAHGPLHCVSLLGFDCEPAVRSELYARLEEQTAGIAQAAKGWADAGCPEAAFWILSGGGQPAPGQTPVPSQGGAWGLGRVLMNEMPQLHPRLLDLHLPSTGTGPDDVSQAVSELLAEFADPRDAEVILSAGQRHTPCIRQVHIDTVHSAEAGQPALASGVRLMPGLQNKIDGLYWRRTDFPAPRDEEILVRPIAAGVNFRDIMLTLGLLPGEAFESGYLGPNLGCECSGIVEAVGPKVCSFAPGDAVTGIAAGTMGSHALCHEKLLMRKPDHLSHAESATLPIALSTAWYALVHQGRLEAGETVLVHGAAGGVGMLAVQIARLLGAEVIATAGSQAKRDVLRLLGVRHVFDSRNLGFVEDVRACTDGQGTDLVLNCLAGEAMLRSLELLKPYGRFLELGKRDLFGDTSVGLRALRKNISYFSIDIDTLAADKPEKLREISLQGWQHLERGELHPLPYQSFPARSVSSAFRTMQKSLHMGKIVLDMADLPETAPSRDASGSLFRNDASYLVTGGLSGFGLATAEWMAERGARHILLASRSGPAADRPGGGPDLLRQRGVRVHVVRADVTEKENLAVTLDTALQDMPPLKGVIHAAAVLDDCVVTNMTPDRIRRVLDPKVRGAWNLHEYTLGHELDLFVVFSSATTFLGSPGQGNYVAANAALETLIHHRRAKGLPGLAAAWGPIADVGMLTRNQAAMESLRTTLGLEKLYSGKALSLLEKLLSRDDAVAAVFSADAKRILRLPSASASRFTAIRALVGESALQNGSIMQTLSGKNPEEARSLLSGLILGVLSSVLRLPEERISSDIPLVSLGVDSLMAVELGLALESAMGDEAPRITVSTGKTVSEMAESLSAALTINLHSL